MRKIGMVLAVLVCTMTAQADEYGYLVFTNTSGTAIFDGAAYYPATATGGSSVTLSSYSGGNSGGEPGGW